jgi:hypothetical protein
LPLKSRNDTGLFLTRTAYPKKDGKANFYRHTEDAMIKIIENKVNSSSR